MERFVYVSRILHNYIERFAYVSRILHIWCALHMSVGYYIYGVLCIYQ